MASRHHSLQMGEVADILELMADFERHNSVRLETRIGLCRLVTKQDICVTMLAHQQGEEVGEVPPLASVSVSCLSTNLRNLRDVVIHALYALDLRLALNEFESAERKEA